MMYSEKLAIAVKSNGKVLREFKDTVYIPFGSEYSILVKNLNSVRARVKISVDGTDATENVWLIVEKNSELELERFIKGGNLGEGNRFKFIERTAAIEEHRGIKVDDGLIRIEFEFERQPAKLPEPTLYRQIWDDKYGSGLIGGNMKGIARTAQSPYGGCGPTYEINCSTASLSGRSIQAQGAVQELSNSASFSDAGITVPGSISSQKFNTVYGFSADGQNHSMIIKILGETEQGKPVVEPVTVKAKPKCVTCGRVNKANAKFCQDCGTSLQIV